MDVNLLMGAWRIIPTIRPLCSFYFKFTFSQMQTVPDLTKPHAGNFSAQFEFGLFDG